MNDMSRAQIGVLGAGSFGTALATVFARGGADVRIWARKAEIAQSINASHKNPEFTGNFDLPTNLSATASLGELVKTSECVIYACPSHAFAEILQKIKTELSAERLTKLRLIDASKGLELETLRFHHEIAAEIFGAAFVQANYFCLSGPSFASELMAGMPTCVSLAGHSETQVRAVQTLLGKSELRLYMNTDLVGCQLGGAMKNVLAIGVGISDGLELGHNTRAALINRGLFEMARLGLRLGAQLQTFLGLAGMGDLVLTCTSPPSRNRQFGIWIGQGKSLVEARTLTGHTVEGISAAPSVEKLAERHGVELSICHQVHAVLRGEKSARAAVEAVLARPVGNEWHL